MLFNLIGALLVALWIIIDENDGLEATITSNHYAWTYGPTVVLACMVVVLSEIDYLVRLLQPWKSLQNGATAKRSMLLDYVSSFRVQTL